MSSGLEKLHLKPTPAERAERTLRKARKAVRRAARAAPYTARHPPDLDEEYGPQPASSAGPSRFSVDDDTDVFARVEEERFRAKLAEAIGDDEYLGGLHARFDAYDAGRVPNRWGNADLGTGNINPALMEEEEYAEYMREGCWRKKNAAAHQEQERAKAAQIAAETEARRKLKAKDEARAAKRRERTHRREDSVRDAYEAAWAALLKPPAEQLSELRMGDVPWPVFDNIKDATPLTRDALASFLLPPGVNRKERLRQTMLRFHPDKFEARVLVHVVETDRELVREALGAVVRAVGELMTAT